MKKESYTNGEWTGELFGNGGCIILQGTDVRFFRMKNCTANIEQLAYLVDKCKEICDRRGEKNVVQQRQV